MGTRCKDRQDLEAVKGLLKVTELSTTDRRSTQAAVLGIYGELDERINQGIPQIEAAMQQHNRTFVKVIYPDAQHAFHNDTGRNYKPDAARDAWAKTLDWFGRYLQA